MRMKEQQMYKIVDSHCHIYPNQIALKAVDAVDAFYDHLPSYHHDGTADTLIKTGFACGISHFIVHSVATTPHQVSSINSFIAGKVEESQGRFTGMGTMHLDSDSLTRDLDELQNLGLKGVKLHPDIQKFCIDDTRAMRIFAMCEERGLPVCVHTGDYRYDYSNPPRTAKVLKAFPRLTFIGAHFGGWSVWEEAMQVLSDYPNLVVDTSSSFFKVQPDLARRLIYAYGPDRVMFGTDYPLWLQQTEIDYLLQLDLDSEEYEKIFWKNVCRIFEIDPAGLVLPENIQAGHEETAC